MCTCTSVFLSCSFTCEPNINQTKPKTYSSPRDKLRRDAEDRSRREAESAASAERAREEGRSELAGLLERMRAEVEEARAEAK